MSKRRTVILAILGLAVFGSAIFTFSKNRDSASEKEAVAVNVRTVAPKDLMAHIESTGRVIASEDRSLYSELASGKVSEIKVQEGDSVKAGEVLLTLSTSELSDQIRAARIQLDIAKANLDQIQQSGKTNYDLSLSSAERDYSNALKDYQDAQALFKSGVSSQSDLDNVKKVYDQANTNLIAAKRNYENYGKASQIKVAQLNVAAANNALLQLQKNKDKAILRAPVDGVVYKVSVSVGDLVTSTKVLVQIAQTQGLTVETNISEFDVSSVQLGQKAILTSDGFDDQYTGRVVYISPVAESVASGQTTETVVKVKIALDTAQTKFKPNFSANVRIDTAQLKQVLTVPYEAIFVGPSGEKVVFVVKSELLKRVVIKTGVSGDQGVEVLNQGLTTGDKVVLNPTDTMKSGMKVKSTLLKEGQ